MLKKHCVINVKCSKIRYIKMQQLYNKHVKKNSVHLKLHGI